MARREAENFSFWEAWWDSFHDFLKLFDQPQKRIGKGPQEGHVSTDDQCIQITDFTALFGNDQYVFYYAEQKIQKKIRMKRYVDYLENMNKVMTDLIFAAILAKNAHLKQLKVEYHNQGGRPFPQIIEDFNNVRIPLYLRHHPRSSIDAQGRVTHGPSPERHGKRGGS